jgi:hypothetical protein
MCSGRDMIEEWRVTSILPCSTGGHRRSQFKSEMARVHPRSSKSETIRCDLLAGYHREGERLPRNCTKETFMIRVSVKLGKERDCVAGDMTESRSYSVQKDGHIVSDNSVCPVTCKPNDAPPICFTHIFGSELLAID